MKGNIPRLKCDVCGRPLTDPRSDRLVWHRDQDGRAYGFKVLHMECDTGEHRPWDPLEYFLGEAGLTWLLELLTMDTKKKEFEPHEAEVADLVEFVRLIRRLHGLARPGAARYRK